MCRYELSVNMNLNEILKKHEIWLNNKEAENVLI